MGNLLSKTYRRALGLWLGLALALMLCLAGAMLAGCSSESPAENSASETDSSAAEQTEQTDAQSEQNKDALYAFSAKTAAAVLAEENANGKSCYSPTSLYLALALLEAGTEGDAQQQLLDLMGATDSTALEETCAAWLQELENEADSDTATDEEADETAQERESQTIEIANSVWVDDGYEFTDEYLEDVRNYFDAEARSAAFGTTDADDQINEWIEDATNGLLSFKGQTTSDDVAMLINAIYFKARWSSVFDEADTAQDVFYGSQTDAQVDMMHQTTTGRYYYNSEYGFHAARLYFEGGGNMTFILPDDGVSLDDLASNEDALEAIMTSDEYSTYKITWTVPRFTLEADVPDLINTLESLGVTDVFDTADDVDTGLTFVNGLSGLGFNKLYISDVAQSTYFEVKEEGAEAAAVTSITAGTTAYIEYDKVDFNLNQPFLFTLTSYNDLPLFVGRIDNF